MGNDRIGDLVDRMEKVEDHVDRLRQWQSWLLGAGFVLGIVATALLKVGYRFLFGA